MTTPFQVRIETTGNALHVWTEGAFDGPAATRLHDLLLAHYSNQEHIYIDTAGLSYLHDGVSDAFRSGLEHGPIPSSRLLFQGRHGRELAPEGSKVHVRESGSGQHRCCGKCHTCKCKGKHA